MRAWSRTVHRTLRRARKVVAHGARPPVPAARRRPVDPFSTLEVQLALGRIETEIAAIRRDEVSFARGHHLVAARMAYDQLLDEACRLADVRHLPESGSLRRVIAEAELRTRGWHW